MTRQLMIGLAVALLAAGLSFAFGCSGFGGGSAFRPLRTETIYSVRYNEETMALTVIQRTGDAVEYAGVPDETFRGLMSAKDKDAFLKESIDGKFKSAKMDFSTPAAN